MNLRIYCVKDRKTAFMQPMLDVNDKSAQRNFQLMLANARGDSVMGFCPEDFALYYLGDFNNESGVISQPTLPVLIVDGSSLEV